MSEVNNIAEKTTKFFNLADFLNKYKPTPNTKKMIGIASGILAAGVGGYFAYQNWDKIPSITLSNDQAPNTAITVIKTIWKGAESVSGFFKENLPEELLPSSLQFPLIVGLGIATLLSPPDGFLRRGRPHPCPRLDKVFDDCFSELTSQVVKK
jgi:hypothetical protein